MNLTNNHRYSNFGFLKDKRLQRYYLNGNDAFRLKLPLNTSSGGGGGGGGSRKLPED